MALSDWLKGQLTSVKADSDGWAGFAESLAQAIATHVEPNLDRIKGRVSLFEQAVEDLAIEKDELGERFSFGTINDDDLALTILQRKDQIHFKRTLSPMMESINRELYGVEVEWQPLYNHVDSDYGVDLRIKPNTDGSSNWWLTSRGVLQVNMDSLSGVAKKDFEATLTFVESEIRRLVDPLIPLRIVYDGPMFYLVMPIMEDYQRASLAGGEAGIQESITLPERRTSYTTEVRLDEVALDYVGFDVERTASLLVGESLSVAQTEVFTFSDAVSVGDGFFDAGGIDELGFDARVIKSVSELGSVGLKELTASYGVESLEQQSVTESMQFNLPESMALASTVMDTSPLDAAEFDGESWSIAPSWEGATVTNLNEEQ